MNDIVREREMEIEIAGPRIRNMLHLQDKHRSSRVWKVKEFCDNKVIPVRYDSRIPTVFHDPRVLRNLERAGFYGVHRVHPIKFDHGLITALIERWRPEVHAFHFSFGEMGITLQDVECLLGLPVDGFPIVGMSQNILERNQAFRDVFLWECTDEEFGRSDQFKITTFFPKNLDDHVQPNSDWPDQNVEQYTARIIYGYLGGLLFPDSSGRYVPTDFVEYLRDINAIGRFSWGSAVLARLFSSLCRTSLRTNQVARPCGCVLLLQLWADLPELQTGLITKRYCLRHVRNNFMTKFHDSALKQKVWAAGSTPNIEQFHKYMAEIRHANEAAYQYLKDIPCEAWALCFDGGNRCGILTTNGSESFNNMLKGCRMLPVTAILKMSYNKMVESFAKRHKIAVQWVQKNMLITPKITAILRHWEKTKHKWVATNYGNNQYVVSHTSRSDPSTTYNYMVDLANRICTCGQWTADGIPCVHVHGVFHAFQQLADDLVAQKYSVQNYLGCYSGRIEPVIFPQNLNVGDWKVLPPIRPTGETPRRGRRQQNRYPGEMDYRAN